LNIEFVDRGVGLGQVMGWAEKGTLFPIVIFGPEDCGKTAFLKQAAALVTTLSTSMFPTSTS